MLWLRVLTCVGLVLGTVFFSCQPLPLYGPLVWHVAFLAINAARIRRLVLERRQLMLTEEQERVGQATFQDLAREELLTLLARATCAHPEGLREVYQVCHRQL